MISNSVENVYYENAELTWKISSLSVSLSQTFETTTHKLRHACLVFPFVRLSA
jgi:hypothetical protein